MPHRVAIAAAVAAVLATNACGSAQWPTSSAQQSGGGSSYTSESRQGDSELRVGGFDAGSDGDPGVFGLPATSGASIDDVLRLGAVATWVDAPDELAISLPASNGCWPTAGEPALESPSRISVPFEAEAACEAPDTARTYTVQVPADADTRAGLEIVVEGLPDRSTLMLPAS